MFKRGQKVVCVEPIDELVKNEIYTIESYDNIGVSVKESKPFLTNMFYAYRFRPLDYDFADSILSRIKKEVESEQLVSL